jgi:hypothetical protein
MCESKGKIETSLGNKKQVCSQLLVGSEGNEIRAAFARSSSKRSHSRAAN